MEHVRPRILVTEIDLSQAGRGAIHPKPFVDAALAALAESDAIRSAGAATFHRRGAPSHYWLEGDTTKTARPASAGLVTSGWFEATGMRLSMVSLTAAGAAHAMLSRGGSGRQPNASSCFAPAASIRSIPRDEPEDPHRARVAGSAT